MSTVSDAAIEYGVDTVAADLNTASRCPFGASISLIKGN